MPGYGWACAECCVAAETADIRLPLGGDGDMVLGEGVIKAVNAVPTKLSPCPGGSARVVRVSGRGGKVITPRGKSPVANDFLGAWVDGVNPGVHVIKDDTLTWSDAAVPAHLNRTQTISVTDGTLILDGSTATIDASKAKLLWSDGEIWTRAWDNLIPPVECIAGLAEDFVGAWEAHKSVYVVSNGFVRWSSTRTSRTTVSQGVFHFDGNQSGATLDKTKTKMVWSDGDVWVKTLDPAEYSGLWQDESASAYRIDGASLKWTSANTSSLIFLGGRLSIEGATITATLAEAGTKLKWSDGDTWTKVYEPYDPSQFDGAWVDLSKRDNESEFNNSYIISDTQLRWSDSGATPITVTGSQLNVPAFSVTATLDDTKSKLNFSNSQVWVRAGFSGLWSSSAGVEASWTIQGSTLTTLKTSVGNEVTNQVFIEGPNALTLTVGERTMQGSLDPLATQLLWPDGDSWKRNLRAGDFPAPFAPPLFGPATL